MTRSSSERARPRPSLLIDNHMVLQNTPCRRELYMQGKEGKDSVEANNCPCHKAWRGEDWKRPSLIDASASESPTGMIAEWLP